MRRQLNLLQRQIAEARTSIVVFLFIALTIWLIFTYRSDMLLFLQKRNFSPEVNAAIITAFITSFTFCGTILLTTYFNYKLQRSNIRDRIYEKRENLYNKTYTHIDNIGYALFRYEQKNDFKTIDLIHKEWIDLELLLQHNIFTFSTETRNSLWIILLFLSHGILKDKIDSKRTFRSLTNKQEKHIFGEHKNQITTASDYMNRYRVLSENIFKSMSDEMKVKAVENDFKILK